MKTFKLFQKAVFIFLLSFNIFQIAELDDSRNNHEIKQYWFFHFTHLILIKSQLLAHSLYFMVNFFFVLKLIAIVINRKLCFIVF